MARVKELNCLICGGEAIIHHVRKYGSKRDNMKVLPLCPMHHNMSCYGVSVHSGVNEWERKHGQQEVWLDLVAVMLDKLEKL